MTDMAHLALIVGTRPAARLLMLRSTPQVEMRREDVRRSTAASTCEITEAEIDARFETWLIEDE